MINIGELVIKAKNARSQEMLASIYKDQDYEAWVGVWLSEIGEPDIFTAASLQLGFSEDCSVDLNKLRNAIDLAGKLHDRGYSIYHCGNCSIYVELESSKKNLSKDLRELLEILAIEKVNFNVITN